MINRQDKFKNLLQPLQLGSITFQNRIFASPQDYPGLTENRFLTEEATRFYERKAMGGFASVCVGDMIVDGDKGRSHPFQMRGNDFMGKVQLTRVSTAIKRHGSVANIELCHAGINASLGLMKENPGYVLGPVDGIRADGVEIRGMNEEEIYALIEQYADAAQFARQCGFEMVTVHGGHGWQISQFISPRDNKRKDRWGGTLENRMRFPLAVVEAIRHRIGRQVPIEFRMSGAELLPDGYDIDEGVRIAMELDGKVDMIHVSVGHHEIDAASMVTHPSMFLPDGCNVQYAAAIKKHVKTPVGTVGALTNPSMMEEIIASGQADVVNLGRQTLADPDLPMKVRLGKDDLITPCIRCFHCFSCSTVGGVFYCSVNPEIGREGITLVGSGANIKKTVLVAGGGVGGMQAAITAAQEGHKVILCEKTSELGGTLLCEENIPFKKNLSDYLKSQSRRLIAAGVEIHLNTAVTPAVANSFTPDVLIAALGARPIKPNLKGMDSSKVLGAEEAYLNPSKVGNRAIIIGGGLVGLELGIHLAQGGHQVTVIEMDRGTIATPPPLEGTSARMSGIMGMPLGYPLVHGVALMEQLKNLPALEIRTSTKALEVLEEGLIVEGPNGEELLEADTIVYAIGQKPLREEAYALAECAKEFYPLGDCLVPRNIYEAASAADQVAKNIGRNII